MTITQDIHIVMFTCAFEGGSLADCLFDLKACGLLKPEYTLEEIREAYNEYVKQFNEI